jgi:hypothetical protein
MFTTKNCIRPVSCLQAGRLSVLGERADGLMPNHGPHASVAEADWKPPLPILTAKEKQSYFAGAVKGTIEGNLICLSGRFGFFVPGEPER